MSLIGNTSDKILYFCASCKTVHHDKDYNKKDGDLQIMSFENLLVSIDKIKLDAKRGN